MKLHPREKVVRRAEMRLCALLIEISGDLTAGEYLQVITNALTRGWHLEAKYMIRGERHPNDPDKPGGLA